MSGSGNHYYLLEMAVADGASVSKVFDLLAMLKGEIGAQPISHDRVVCSEFERSSEAFASRWSVPVCIFSYGLNTEMTLHGLTRTLDKVMADNESLIGHCIHQDTPGGTSVPTTAGRFSNAQPASSIMPRYLNAQP